RDAGRRRLGRDAGAGPRRIRHRTGRAPAGSAAAAGVAGPERRNACFMAARVEGRGWPPLPSNTAHTEPLMAVLPPNVGAEDFASAVREFVAAVGEDWVFTSDEDLELYRDPYSLM